MGGLTTTMTSSLNSAILRHFRRSFVPKRERSVTPVLATLCLAVVVSACGGGKQSSSSDTYAKATSSQETCCEHAPNRDGCLKEIVRVEAFAQKAPANQATYACVVDHFTCDPATGHATQPSAQAQIDCIQDLQ
ncbi:MAG TPA: hypothetical protein VGC41_09935 [Kofleriaceae bacterium]